MRLDNRSVARKVGQWCRRQVGWLFIAAYFAILVWSARSLWHVRQVPLFLAVIFGLIIPLVIAVGFIGGDKHTSTNDR